MANVRFYRSGEECEFTGRSQMLHGQMAYEFIVVADSHRIGSKGWTYETPSETWYNGTRNLYPRPR